MAMHPSAALSSVVVHWSAQGSAATVHYTWLSVPDRPQPAKAMAAPKSVAICSLLMGRGFPARGNARSWLSPPLELCSAGSQSAPLRFKIMVKLPAQRCCYALRTQCSAFAAQGKRINKAIAVPSACVVRECVRTAAGSAVIRVRAALSGPGTVTNMSGVKLGWKSEDQIYKETVTIPVVAGLIVVVVTVVGLYLFREGRTYTSSLGSRRVTSGGKSVRRSVRCAILGASRHHELEGVHTQHPRRAS